MTVTNESGGRLNAFANEPKVEVIASEPSNYGKLQVFGLILTFAVISIIGIYFIF